MPEGGSGASGSLIPDPFMAAANVATEAMESAADITKTLLTPGKVNLPQATGDVLDIASAMRQVGVDKKYLLKAQRMQNKHEIELMRMQSRTAVLATVATHPLFWLIAAGSITYSGYFALKLAALREKNSHYETRTRKVYGRHILPGEAWSVIDPEEWYIESYEVKVYDPITAQDVLDALPDIDDLLSFVIPGRDRTISTGSENTMDPAKIPEYLWSALRWQPDAK